MVTKSVHVHARVVFQLLDLLGDFKHTLPYQLITNIK